MHEFGGWTQLQAAPADLVECVLLCIDGQNKAERERQRDADYDARNPR